MRNVPKRNASARSLLGWTATSMSFCTMWRLPNRKPNLRGSLWDRRLRDPRSCTSETWSNRGLCHQGCGVLLRELHREFQRTTEATAPALQHHVRACPSMSVKCLRTFTRLAGPLLWGLHLRLIRRERFSQTLRLSQTLRHLQALRTLRSSALRIAKWR